MNGVPKGALRVDGRPILERQLEVLVPLFSRVFVVANGPGPWATMGLTVVRDRVAGGAGPLAGIDAALSALHPGENAVVCVGCDMPFLAAPALALVRDFSPASSAVVPLIADCPEPLFARYGRDCAAPIAAALASGRFKAVDLVRSLDPIWLGEAALRAADPDLRSFENVNTPEAHRRAGAVTCG